MTNFRKVAAGIIVGAAITSAPLVAFAAPAFAAPAFAESGTTTPVSGVPSYMNIPPMGYRGRANEPHVLAHSAAAGQSHASHVLVSAGSAGSVRDGNAARCGGGINC